MKLIPIGMSIVLAISVFLGCGKKDPGQNFEIKDGEAVAFTNTGNCKVYRVYDGCEETNQRTPCIKRHAVYFSDGCHIWNAEKPE